MTQIRASEFANLDKIWHLRQTKLVEGLDDDDLRDMEEISKDRIYGKGEQIFARGESANQVYILFRGCVRAAVGSESGKERIVGIFKAGDILGENVLGSRPVQQATAVAHEECWIATISSADFVDLLERRPKVALNFIQILSQKLAEAREDIATLSFLGTQQRLAKTLLKLGINHGNEITSQESVRKLRFPLSHEHLARLIGANRPHVSTIMSDFRKRGWIHYQGRKLLINMRDMASLSDSAVNGNYTF